MPVELKFYGIIGKDVTATSIKRKVDAIEDTSQELVGRFDSDGGSVRDGRTIHDVVTQYPGPTRAIVESFAGSISSYLLTAFDEVEITPNGMVMIHNPTSKIEGDDEDLTHHAEFLAGLKQNMVEAYAKQMDLDTDEVVSLMKAETWYSADEAIDAGLATRIKGTAKPTTLALSNIDLPYRAVASLRCEAPSGDTSEHEETTEMPESNTPVAATVAEIKAAFPKAKGDFIVSCLEKNMPIASVAAAAAEELMAENEELTAKVAAMEEEMATLKASAEASTNAEGDGETEAEANAQNTVNALAKGLDAVSNVTSSDGPSATARWNEAVAQYSKHPRAKAVRLANRNNPGLREQMLAEANANRN